MLNQLLEKVCYLVKGPHNSIGIVSTTGKSPDNLSGIVSITGKGPKRLEQKSLNSQLGLYTANGNVSLAGS